MNKYDYVNRALYMVILSQETVEGNSIIASRLWEIVKSNICSRRYSILGFFRGAK